MPVIPDSQGLGAGIQDIQGMFGYLYLEILFQRKIRGVECRTGVGHLHIVCETLDSIPTLERDIDRISNNIKPSIIGYHAKLCSLI